MNCFPFEDILFGQWHRHCLVIWAGPFFAPSLAMFMLYAECFHGTLYDNQHLLPVHLSIFAFEQVK
jgi:hypothetical protein